jgi:hypothetical protein
MSYVTLATFKETLQIPSADTTDDTRLQAVLDATDQLINNYCERPAGFISSTQTRYYTAERGDYCLIDDLVSITTLQTDNDGDGVYETTWSASQYILAPRNAVANSQPYNEIDTVPGFPKVFPVEYLGVKVVGSFGYKASSAPQAVQQAALIQAGAVYFSLTAPSGAIGGADLGGIIRLARALHPEAQVLLEPYRKRLGLAS